MARGQRFAAALVALAMTAATCSGATTRAAREHDIKAALLVNFARYVAWPAEAAGAAPPLVVAVLGEQPLNDSLRAAARGVIVRGRRVVVVAPAADRDLDGADIAFVPAGVEQPSAARLQALAARHVLVVGEAPDILLHGGTMRLVLQDERVRFQAIAGAETRTGLRISSALLDLATIVTVPLPPPAVARGARIPALPETRP